MIQRIGFQSIPVADQDRALAFYCDILGFERHTDVPFGEDWRWIFLSLNGAETRLHFAKVGEVQYDGTPALALFCEDVDAEARTWASKGVEIVNAPQDAPWMEGARWAMIRDSENNLIFVESFKGGSNG